ncbi:MAG: hypothetical protein M1817_006713 [Caeruleum heppii]|nr:MAG: hypothetical protein M1817_006713 [Caeruleum heppii]
MLCRLELSSEPALNQICNVQLFDDSTLVLSLAWHPQDRHLLGVTLSNGAICLLRVDLPPQRESRDILHTLSDEVNRHELEAWTLAWAPFRDEDSETGEIRHIIYSGGDDAKLQVSAYGESDSAEANVYTIHPQKSLKRLHDAGVTAILPLFALNRTEQIMEDVLLTGSYDDHVRVIDPATAQVLTELNLGGGGWRLNLMDRTRAQSHDSRPSDGFGFLVLASCMHAGARVLNVTRRPADVTKGAWSIEILAQFEEHESMNYASAVQPVEEAGEWAARSYTCVSTSFYDRRLCVWKYSEPSEAGD